MLVQSNRQCAMRNITLSRFTMKYNNSNSTLNVNLVRKTRATIHHLLLKALAANENANICRESSIDATTCKQDSTAKASVMTKKQTTANCKSNSHMKSPSKVLHPLSSSVNGFLQKNNLIDLFSLKAPSKRVDNWVQLSGHEDSFARAGPETIWKKRGNCKTEVEVYERLMCEPISEMIPKFYRDVTYKGDNFIELEDLLCHYKGASIMDIKMGSRTFLESEVNSLTARRDLYEKMIKIDSNEPTQEEHLAQAVTKLRYMQFRENLSSSSNLGFRIEGFKVENDLKHNKNLHMVKSRDEVQQVLTSFFLNKPEACLAVVNRLRKLRKYFENSDFFRNHEVIGSSILIIYTADKAGVWMIDFAKTLPVPENIEIDHRRPWRLGNHEDGYLFGLDNLVSILDEIPLRKSTN